MKYKYSKTIPVLVLAVLAFANCQPEKDDDNTPLLAALLLNNRPGTSPARTTGTGTVTGTRQQQTQTSSGRSAGNSAATSARSAARSGFFIPDKKGGYTRSELLAYMKTRYMGFSVSDLKNYPSQPVRFLTQSQPGGSSGSQGSSTSGPSCSGAGCSGDGEATLSGESTCNQGQTWSGGTVTLNSMVTSMTGLTQDGLTINITGGTTSFSNCKLSPKDLANFPATNNITIASGTVTPRGSFRLNDSFNESTGISTTQTIEDMTINSSNFVIGGTTLTLTNLRSVTNLTESINTNNITFLSSTGSTIATADIASDLTNVFGISASSTVNGSLVLTGQVNGADAGATINLSSRSITYRFTCTKALGSMTDADWASESICTYTVN